MVFLTIATLTGCATQNSANPQRVEAIKAAFKENVKVGTALSAHDPKVRLYLTAAAPAICDLSRTHEFAPSQLEAALNAVDIPDVNTPTVLLARASLLNIYSLTLGFVPRSDIETNSFAANLLEVLCAGMTEGLGLSPQRDEPAVTTAGPVTGAASHPADAESVTRPPTPIPAQSQ